MILDIDFLINFFKKNSSSPKRNEFSEQEDTSTSTSSGGSSGGTGKQPPKWADSYPIKRGKANMLGKGGEKWETGLTRGAANQIW